MKSQVRPAAGNRSHTDQWVHFLVRCTHTSPGYFILDLWRYHISTCASQRNMVSKCQSSLTPLSTRLPHPKLLWCPAVWMATANCTTHSSTLSLTICFRLCSILVFFSCRVRSLDTHLWHSEGWNWFLGDNWVFHRGRSQPAIWEIDSSVCSMLLHFSPAAFSQILCISQNYTDF